MINKHKITMPAPQVDILAATRQRAWPLRTYARWRVAANLIAIAFCLSITGCELVTEATPTTDSPVTGIVATVETLVLSEQQDITIPRYFSGVLLPKRSSELAFKRAGRIEKLLTDQGDAIKAGQVLAELDTASLQAELVVLKAQRTAAYAKLNELVAGPRRQTIEAARAQIKELQAMRDLAKITFDRRARLAGGDAISKQDIDDARLQLSATEGRLEAQLLVLSELEEGTRKEQVAAQQAQVDQLDATIESLHIQLRESTLLAPYDAIVSRRLADEGVVVSPGATVMKIVERAPPEAWIGLPLDIQDTLEVGAKYSLTISDQERLGSIKSFLPELDPVSRTRTVVFDIEPISPVLGKSKTGSDPVLGNVETDSTDFVKAAVLGQIVKLKLSQNIHQSGFWLPMTALNRGERGLWTALAVVEQNDGVTHASKLVLQHCSVEIIQIDSDRVFVRGTLKNGDRIVSAGIQKLTVGQTVRLAEAEPS